MIKGGSSKKNGEVFHHDTHQQFDQSANQKAQVTNVNQPTG